MFDNGKGRNNISKKMCWLQSHVPKHTKNNQNEGRFDKKKNYLANLPTWSHTLELAQIYSESSQK